MQLDPLGQPVTALLCITEVFDLPVVLFEIGQAAVAVQGQATLAVGGGQPANPPGQMRDRQVPAQLFFEQGFRGRGFVTSLVGDFQRDLAGTSGQAGGAATQRAGQADIVVILALQPEQRAAARILGGANADLAVDLPAVEAAQLLFVLAP